MNKQELAIYNFLKKCNISFNDMNKLEGTLIQRDDLLSDAKYVEVEENIKELNNYLVVQILTCLQTDEQI